ncbi:MAG: carbohydrate kinase family protein [Candidatus Peregrinibacteria bacterium]|nr:carbohydrate kinase family protein [Candidatus Peregrinibacteria bacterium]
MPKQKFDICTFGSITLDLFLEANEITSKGEYIMLPIGDKIKLDGVHKFVGGGAANCGVGFVKLGLSTAAFGVIGDDEEAVFIAKDLKKNGLNTDFLIREKNESSSFSIILTGKNGRRTVFHHRSTNQDFGADSLKKAMGSRAIYIGHLYHGAEDLLFAISGFNGLVAWNPGKTQFESGFNKFSKVFPRIDVLILNVEEAESFTGIEAPRIDLKDLTAKKIVNGFPVKEVADLRTVAQKFLDAGVKRVVITDGEKGTQCFDQDEHFFVRASDQVPVSTLGAGDAFSVGFVGAILHGQDTVTAMKWGAASSGGVLRGFGAQNGQLTLEEIERVS